MQRRLRGQEVDGGLPSEYPTFLSGFLPQREKASNVKFCCLCPGRTRQPFSFCRVGTPSQILRPRFLLAAHFMPLHNHFRHFKESALLFSQSVAMVMTPPPPPPPIPATTKTPQAKWAQYQILTMTCDAIFWATGGDLDAEDKLYRIAPLNLDQ